MCSCGHPALCPHEATVQKRFKDAITPEHLTAYMLHPKYRGENLTDEQHKDASTWLVNHYPSFITTFISFQAKAAPFPSTYFLDKATNISPETWWQGVKWLWSQPSFADLAGRLVTSPASSASIERIFSAFSLIHNKIRNKLGIQRTSKLVFCYHMLRGKNDFDW